MELFPFLERTYRVDPGRRIFFGQSAGAAFGCYTLLTRPGLFTDFVIVSPGMPNQGIFRLEAAWAEQHTDLKAKVFLTDLDRSGRKSRADRRAQSRARTGFPATPLPRYNLRSDECPALGH